MSIKDKIKTKLKNRENPGKTRIIISDEEIIDMASTLTKVKVSLLKLAQNVIDGYCKPFGNLHVYLNIDSKLVVNIESNTIQNTIDCMKVDNKSFIKLFKKEIRQKYDEIKDTPVSEL